MKTLIILGNGKSLKDIDLTKFSNFDTFGLNGAYLKYQELNWFPTYYGFFREDSKIWENSEIRQFIENNYLKCERFFYLSTSNIITNVKEYTNVQPITLIEPSELSYNQSEFSSPLFVEFRYLKDILTNKYGEVVADDKIKNYFTKNKFDNMLNASGLYKLVEGLQLDENDHIRLPRFHIGWIPPKSFDEFINVGGNSGYFACLIGYLMGYEKIILLGFDFNFVANNDIIDTTETFWFDNYFNGKSYNIKDMCNCMTNESMIQMQLGSFELLKNMIKVNGLKLDVVNCTEGSKLNVFRKSTLEKEL